MILAKPPIVGDVAELVGNYAEKVENRSLLLNKFPIHKRWPVDPYSPETKWDDASRWSFIRVTENGSSVLDREYTNRDKVANGQNVAEAKRKKARAECELIRRLGPCSCRRLDPLLSKARKEHVTQFVTRFAVHPERHIVLIGKLCGPLAVNLSDSLIQNAGICLDRMFGEPYIPGSAVKGVSRHVALARLYAGKMTVEAFQQLFGTADVDFSAKGDLSAYSDKVPEERRNRKGGFDFLAAYPISDVQVAVDMTNVHYPDYYQSGELSDLANEKPRPNPFPVTSPGANFAFCIARNGMKSDASLVGLMCEIVREALEKQGIGAKTAAGYGWFDCSETDRWMDNRRREQEDAVRKGAVSELASRIAALAGQQAETPVFRAEIAAIEAQASFADLPSKDREELARQKKRLPMPSAQDVIRERWGRSKMKAIVNGREITKFATLGEVDKKAVVEVLRDPGGIGHDVWQTIRDGQKGDVANGVMAIRKYCKDVLKLGKMP